MKILITGATGLVGTRLVEKLLEKGYHHICALTRNKKSKKLNPLVTWYEWDIEQSKIEENALKEVDIIFNLAGENIADGRWSDKKKNRILKSRTEGPKLIWEKLKEHGQTPRKFISASAVGIYGNREGEFLNEESSFGDDFLANVCKAWEEAVTRDALSETQIHFLRTGVVLSDREGALKKMLPAFQAGIAGKLGSGKQYMSWIHLDDLVDQYIYLMENDIHEAAFNAVAPEAVTNLVFTKALGKVLHRPTLFPVPAFALKTLFGEMSCVLLEGQNVTPKRFIEAGFKFNYPLIDDALENLLKKKNENIKELLRYQYIDRPIEEIFNFFSDGRNLESLTPDSMGFRMTKMSTSSIEKGTLIDYKLKVHGIPLKWQAKILDFKENHYFIDEQIKGPYKKWIHRHEFIQAKDGGTIIKDHVRYVVPLGFLGKVIAGPFIEKDIHQIFKYRFDYLNRKYV